jgi:hypothetical protein
MTTILASEAHYRVRKAQLSLEHASLERTSGVIAGLRVVTFTGAVGVLAVAPFLKGPASPSSPVWSSWVAGVSGLAFLVLVFVHAVIERRAHVVHARKAYAERGLQRVADHQPSRVEGTSIAVDPSHPYAGDLDLFGPRSFSSWLDGVHTHEGQAALSRLMLEPAAVAEARLRQEFVKELADAHAFRESLSANAELLAERQPDKAAMHKLLAWSAEAARPVNALTILATALFGGATLGLVIAALAGPAIFKAPAIALVGVALVVRAGTQSQARVILDAAAPLVGTPERYAALFGLAVSQPLESAKARQLQVALAQGAGAQAAAKALGTIGTLLDARENGLFRLFIGPLLQWDLLCSLLLEQWRLQHGKLLDDWVQAVATFEATAALSTRAFEEPDGVWPEFVSGSCFVAEGLGHPLVAVADRVCNDVALRGPGEALVITGSNMAGKSTLLRAMGLNAVVAYAGGKVCASKLQIGQLAVVTSIKVADALADGVSFFYAEVRRLKLVLDTAERQPTLFLLDEILRGTNSRERIIGAKAVVERLLGLSAIGAVTTHDLAISQLAENEALKVVNVHFEEQVEGDVMRFDYVLRPGVVQTSNALRLMKQVGLPVGELGGEPGGDLT